MAAPKDMVKRKTLYLGQAQLLKEGTFYPARHLLCAIAGAECDCRRKLQTLADERAFRLCSGGREEIETRPISCPVCHAPNSRRSKRRSVRDHLLGLVVVMPWRCESGEARFH